MKQCTTLEQTAKLIELGFEKPRYYSADKYTIIHTGFEIINYSIGELIEMLPKIYNSVSLSMGYHYMANVWIVRYPSTILIHNEELIDALYDMIVKLKEEEEI